MFQFTSQTISFGIVALELLGLPGLYVAVHVGGDINLNLLHLLLTVEPLAPDGDHGGGLRCGRRGGLAGCPRPAGQTGQRAGARGEGAAGLGELSSPGGESAWPVSPNMQHPRWLHT